MHPLPVSATFIARMPYRPGDVIEKRYKVLDKLGAGAHGVVYRARDLETRDEVALKFLQSGIGLDPEYNRRLEREATAMAKLRGTCAVYVHGLRLHHDGMTYLVMEMLHGRDYEKYLGEAEKLGGRIKPKKLLALLRPVAETLHLAHGQNVVHRDLKPANIMVLNEGGVRLLDFGLVKMLDEASMTGQGIVAGSPSYIAPEAWKGDPSILDHRIDVYSLGMIVFRSLAGRTPVQSSNVLDHLLWATKNERPSLHALRPKLPVEIDDWVGKALAIRPDDRFQDIGTMWGTLEKLLGTTAQAPY